MRRLLWLAPLVAVMAGCGGPSDTAKIKAVLLEYAHAFAKHDYQAICDQFFAPKLADGVEQNAGIPCESAIRPAILAAKDPTLAVLSVHLDGQRATARVRTGAANQPTSDDSIALVKVAGAWRIASLATAGPQPPGG
jgi:hypothetical protein